MTWEIPILTAAICFSLYYCIFLLSGRKGLAKRSPIPTLAERPFVSIVIAARNEQLTLSRCLKSVLDQDYPAAWEVILVDDGSTDDTLSIARNIASHNRRVRVLTLSNTLDLRASRKPSALAAGIGLANGEIILTTDADCIVGREWIAAMVATFDAETAFVAGPVQELPSSRIISQISQLEFLALIGLSAGLINNGEPIICNGANVAYRRTSFNAVSGFGAFDGFCDDEVLMHRMHSRKVGQIRYSLDGRSMVSTDSPSTLLSFWKQRIRWASKRGHYEDSRILLKLTALYFSFFFLGILLPAAFFSPFLFPFLGGLFLCKILVDYSVLNLAARTFGQKARIHLFLFAELFHVPYIVLAALAGQFTSLEWKGRTIRE